MLDRSPSKMLTSTLHRTMWGLRVMKTLETSLAVRKHSAHLFSLPVEFSNCISYKLGSGLRNPGLSKCMFLMLERWHAAGEFIKLLDPSSYFLFKYPTFGLER